MAKLYELDEALKNFDFYLDEETGETNIDEYENLLADRNAKIKNIGLIIKNKESNAMQYAEAEKGFAKRRKSEEKSIEFLRNYLANSLNGETFRSDDGLLDISYRKSEVLSIENDATIPEAYLVPQEPKIDKMGLKKAIKNGETFDGIFIEEKQNMQIK